MDADPFVPHSLPLQTSLDRRAERERPLPPPPSLPRTAPSELRASGCRPLQQVQVQQVQVQQVQGLLERAQLQQLQRAARRGHGPCRGRYLTKAQ